MASGPGERLKAFHPSGWWNASVRLTCATHGDSRREYNEELQWRGGGKIRVTDKMPGNFLHLWLIALLFAEGGYIHCVREPLATCFSCFTTDLGDAHSYTADFTTLAGYYQLYADLMRHWAEVLPVRIFTARYEDLVKEPESSVRRLLEAAGLPWNAACLSFHESHRLAQTASYAAVREPIHPRSLERWRAYRDYLGPLEAALKRDRAAAARIARLALPCLRQAERASSSGSGPPARLGEHTSEGPMARILVLGGDGFCGWPTSLYLSRRGHDVTIVDNLSRRKIDVELEVESLTPIRPISRAPGGLAGVDRKRDRLRANNRR